MLAAIHKITDNGWSLTIHASDDTEDFHASITMHRPLDDLRYDARALDLGICIDQLSVLTFWHENEYPLPPTESTWTERNGWGGHF